MFVSSPHVPQRFVFGSGLESGQNQPELAQLVSQGGKSTAGNRGITSECGILVGVNIKDFLGIQCVYNYPD